MLSILKSGEDIATPDQAKLEFTDADFVEKHALTRNAIVGSFPSARSLVVPPCCGFLGIGDFILRVHGKYFEIGKGMFSVETAPLKVHIKLGA
jgi:hypothetical protein